MAPSAQRPARGCRSRRDPLELPSWLLDALDCFDGGSPGEALSRVAAKTGRFIPSTLVRKLADFGLLEEV
jgi:hypothetical protein